jgi:hypothetical protein
MKWEVFGRKQSQNKPSYYPENSPGWTEKHYETLQSERKVGVRAKIRTGNPATTTQKRYRLSKFSRFRFNITLLHSVSVSKLSYPCDRPWRPIGL